MLRQLRFGNEANSSSETAVRSEYQRRHLALPSTRLRQSHKNILLIRIHFVQFIPFFFPFQVLQIFVFISILYIQFRRKSDEKYRMNKFQRKVSISIIRCELNRPTDGAEYANYATSTFVYAENTCCSSDS